MKKHLLLIGLSILLNVFFLALSPLAATVISTGDNTTPPYTAGELRHALFNAVAGETIDFDIDPSDSGHQNPSWGHYWSIQLNAALPQIPSDVIIDGTTQATNHPNFTNPLGPEIEINGGGTLDRGLGGYTKDNWTIKHLVINEFATVLLTGTGVYIQEGSTNCKVYGCYIGTTPSGEALARNVTGISIVGGRNNIVGSIEAANKNVISGNTTGLEISFSSSNEVLGNYIGVTAHSNGALPNSSYGIHLLNEAKYNNIGNGSEAGRNVVAGSSSVNIFITGANAITKDGKIISSRGFKK